MAHRLPAVGHWLTVARTGTGDLVFGSGNGYHTETRQQARNLPDLDMCIDNYNNNDAISDKRGIAI